MDIYLLNIKLNASSYQENADTTSRKKMWK